MTRIVITGDRDWQNRAIIYSVLQQVIEKITSIGDEIVITEGEAEGADKISRWAAEDLQVHYPGVHIDSHPARWYRHDSKKNREFFFKGAGPERNDEMLDLKNPPPSLVLAFHNKLDESKGTRHCVLGAIKRNIYVQLFAETEDSFRNPSAYASTFIASQNGKRPEEILQQAIQSLHPLTW